jgi:hypothetical protein
MQPVAGQELSEMFTDAWESAKADVAVKVDATATKDNAVLRRNFARMK